MRTSAEAPAPLARRVGRALIWLLALVVGLLAWATVARVTYGGGPEVDRLGTAQVLRCVEHGPVSRFGVGTTHTCTAEVRWSNGQVEQREFSPGQLSPADTGAAVPVYLDIPEGVRGELSLGRNDSARFSALRLPANLLLGVVVAGLGLGAAYTGYRVFRPHSARPERGERPERRVRGRAAEQRKAGRRAERRWPVTAADLAATPTPRRTVRLRLLAAWCVLAVLYTLLATVPRYDAPRSPEFTSPWPRLGDALLLDVPPTAVAVLGTILAVLLAAAAGASRTDAARVVRHGPDYVGRDLAGRGPVERRVADQLGRLAAHDVGFRLAGVAVGVLLLAVAAWATMRAINAWSSQAPVPVQLASLRDAVLLAALASLWLGTVETRHRRLTLLLERHRETSRASAGTGSGSAES
ncbi:hypothetical protein SAMN05421810_104120 [Amycolatopsis arida]|uniref:Uncharacterized protein n=1 Tax=Amycolatopsis arida TaxID=587909 RepID=A0A1I5UUR0_9PSEU|nr:DUF6346 domain-containing protein [Amycolatopsis arida]TDX91039.1 hypothetical protein CLV69_106119 [Amycolatopsis arida]SFP98928.1 hypothetical protein SAMN05421810_104120 [Amycolatopsis arida]